MRDGERATVQVAVLHYLQLPRGVVFRMLERNLAKKYIDARIAGLEPLDFDGVDKKGQPKPDVLGRFRVVDRVRGGGFKKGNLLELTFERGHFAKTFFRQYFDVLDDGVDPYARKVAMLPETVAPVEPAAEPDVVKPDAKPDTAGPGKVAEIHAAIALLDKDDGNAFNLDGSPRVQAIVEVLGYDVTAAERDAAWEAMQG